jgi:hypothetical protein
MSFCLIVTVLNCSLNELNTLFIDGLGDFVCLPTLFVNIADTELVNFFFVFLFVCFVLTSVGLVTLDNELDDIARFCGKHVEIGRAFINVILTKFVHERIFSTTCACFDHLTSLSCIAII